MKRFYIAIALIFVSLAGIYAMNTKKAATSDNHPEIERLWKDFEASRKADRPQKSLEILSEIKELARKQRLPWDFYKAGRNFIDVSSERNWKVRGSLEEQFQTEIKQFDEPVLTFFNGIFQQGSGMDIIKEHRAELESGHNSGFYAEDGNLMQMDFSRVLVKLIGNDYQYALWSTVLGSMHGEPAVFEESSKMLAEALEGHYPCEQFLELVPILRQKDLFRKNEALEIFADRYKTKAVSLFARQQLLESTFYSLSSNGKATSEEYKALRNKLEDFENDRKAFASKEKDIAECCGRVQSFISTLDDKSIFFNIENGHLNVMLRNLDEVELSIAGKDKKSILSRTLKNSVGSYYVLDTIRMDLPEMNDGTYSVNCKNGKIKVEQTYDRYSISMAQYHDAYGYAVYLADALTGEPLKKADLTIIDDTGKVKAEYKGLNLNGYTYLPQDFVSHFSSESWKNHLRCSYTDSKGIVHLTRDGRLSISNTYTDEYENRPYASILTDRTAYTPGETVSFKVVSFFGDRTKELHTFPSGKKLTAKLFDVQGNEIGTRELVTNEFGSGAGEFVLERRERNGWYRLSVYDRNQILSSVSLRVDDFVLPTFELEFDKNDRFYFPGDEVVVTGSVKSYSGHSLSSADIQYNVKSSYTGKVIEDGGLKVGKDGRFVIRFKTERVEKRNFESFEINVRVTDTTGETLEWHEGIYVTSSIPLNARLLNKAEAKVSDIVIPGRINEYKQTDVAADDIFRIAIELQPYGAGTSLTRDGLKISYALKSDGKTVAEGNAVSGETLSLDTSGWPSGIYEFSAIAVGTDVYGNVIKSESSFDIIKIKDSDTSLPFDVESIFKVSESGGIALQIGGTSGPLWVCIDLFGEDGRHLASRLVHLEGKKGAAGSLTTIKFEKQPDWAGEISLKAVYFKNYNKCTYLHDFTIPATTLQLPLSFTRFYDKTVPGTPYSIEISTRPEVECAISIFDKSTESISRNIWKKIELYPRDGFYVDCYYTTGTNSSEGRRMYRTMASGAVMKSANAAPMMLDALDEEAVYDMEEAAVEYGSAEMPVPSPEEAEVQVRENFANTIAFEPFLRSDMNGKAELGFTTADKLSTYYVQVFAHDKNMNNGVMRREMMVTIPVKVSIVEPLYLYEGDRYIVKASLASSLEEPVRGRLRADFYDGKDYKSLSPVKTMFKDVELQGLQSVSEEFAFEVPEISGLGVKLTFVADDKSSGSDAVFVFIPVYPAEQILTEAHSSILHDGESLESLLATLKSQFVNVSGENAEMKDISVLQMVKEAIPAKVEASSDDVISVSEALYVRLLAKKLGVGIKADVADSVLLDKILGCRRSDGGFAWFEGMNSSPVVTATLLQRYASLRDRGLIEPQNSRIPYATVTEAVKFLDKVFFSDRKRPEWCGGLSWEQYVSTRAMFANVEFSTDGISKEVWKNFRKEIKDYLTPDKERGLNGYILGKARRMKVLMDLSGNGTDLARIWGIKFGTDAKLSSSLSKDLASIEEYAVGHKCGGWYYPNAVMPFRGLLESEAYAHAFIADLLRACGSKEIADGICLWLMVQKETQKWNDDAAFVDAISSILDASEQTKSIRVITLSKTFNKPFADIKPAGNGFSIESKYYLEQTIDGKQEKIELKEGQELNVGDKLIAEYRIWNEENRSFVKVTAPRMASLRPAEQLSGSYGWWMRPLSVNGWISFSPSGYRSVLSDRTEYWFDSYPEENTTITEEFYVTQAGTFQMATMEIESLYAPHYRANGDGQPAIATH